MTARVALSPNDSLWLNMDTPENLMVIESIMWFDEPLDYDAVVETLRQRLITPYPVFTWRPLRADGIVGLDHWAEDPDFDLLQHVTLHELEGSGHDAVQAFLENRMSIPLPRNRPLWHAHVLTGDDVSAVILRFHHAIADGTALVRVLIDMTTETPEGDDAPSPAAPGQMGTDTSSAPSIPHRTHPDHQGIPSEPVPTDRPHAGRIDRATRTLSHLITLPLAAGAAATHSAVGLVHMLDPDHEGSWAWKLASQAEGTADAIDKLLVGTPPDALPFGRPGLTKRADWAPPIDLAEVKTFAKSQGTTVNDVMMAALSGALRRYIMARGEVPRDVVTMIPVNLRPWDAPLPPHLGNKFALVAVELPLAEPTPLARLAEAKARMDVVKQGPEAVLTFGLAHAIGSVGAVTGTVSRQMISFFGNKSFGVTTNVHGPTSKRYFAGREMMGVLGWVPGASQQTLGACIFSYNGQIRVGFKADANVIPDVTNLVAAFTEEMADLLAEAPGADG